MPIAIDEMLSQMVRSGLSTVFGNPGTFEQAFIDKIRAYPELNYVLCLHESVVVGAAMGYSRKTKQISAVQLHGSVGLGNASGMLLEAKQSKIPILVYVGENSQHDEAYQGFLAYDVTSMAKPICKEVVRVTVPQQLTRQLRRAIQIAQTPPFGPVLFAVPMDVLESEVPNSTSINTSSVMCGNTSELVIDKVVRYLLESQNPIIITGDSVAWSKAQEVVRSLAHLVGAPIFGLGWTMCNAIYDDPLFQEPLTHAVGKGNAAVFNEGDLILLFGAPLAWEVLPHRSGYFKSSAKVIQVDSDPMELGRNFFADIAVLGNVKEILDQICARFSNAIDSEYKERANIRLQSAIQRKLLKRQQMEEKWTKVARVETNHPFDMLGALATFMRDDDLIFEEAMTNQQFLRHTFPLSNPELYYPALSRTLGAGLTGVIGAAVAEPNRRSVGLSSDGAAMYVPQALWTAANLKLNVLFVIINNQSYRVLKLNLDDYRNRLGQKAGQYPFMDIKNPIIDFVELAFTFGIPAERAKTKGEVYTAMEMLMKNAGPKLLDLQVSGSINL